MNPIRVLLADDHALVRAGFCALLGEMTDVTVVAEAANGRDAMKLVEQHQPRVVVMDISMPELNGLDATARITAQFPGVRVIILSMNASDEYVHQAFRAGAMGYLLKDVTPAEFAEAIHAVARGDTYLSPAISKHVIAACRLQTDGPRRPLDKLTTRQREVLQLIAEGKSTKQIAQQLGISFKTAEGHRTQLMQSLDIHDVSGLVRYAIRFGLIRVEQCP